MNNSLQLHLTVDEINLILKALGQQPFAEVHNIIEHIRSQTIPQLQQTQQAAPAAGTPEEEL